MTARTTFFTMLFVTLMSERALANVVGSELQNFNAAASAADAVTVNTGRTLGEGRFSLGLFANIAANSLPYFQDEIDPDRDRSKKINDTVTGLDFHVAYGVTDRWDLSVSMPSIVAQSIRNKDSRHGEFGDLGNTELRFGTKYQVLTQESLQLAVLGSVNYNRVDGNPYTGDVRWPGASLELALSTQISIVDLSVNLGHRWRKSEADPVLRATLPIDPAGDQWLISTSAAIDLPGTDTDLIAEVYSAYAERVISDFSTRKNSIVESVFGFRTPLPNNLQFHAGIGAEVSHSESSADYRAYLGLRWMTDAKRKGSVETVKALPPALPVATVNTGVLNRPADVVVNWDDVYFKFDSTEFRAPSDLAMVDKLGAALSAQPIERVVIEGYTCELGSDEYNFDLSDHRAAAIEKMLIQGYHVAPEKLVTVGWGEKHPKFDNTQEVTRMNNRRVTFRIYYQKALTTSSQNVAH